MAQKREIIQGQAKRESRQKQVNEQEQRNKIHRVFESYNTW